MQSHCPKSQRMLLSCGNFEIYSKPAAKGCSYQSCCTVYTMMTYLRKWPHFVLPAFCSRQGFGCCSWVGKDCQCCIVIHKPAVHNPFQLCCLHPLP